MSKNTTGMNLHHQDNTPYIAHVRATDKKIQTLETHLLEVAEITKRLAAKINVPEAGELIGLLHDFGKWGSKPKPSDFFKCF